MKREHSCQRKRDYHRGKYRMHFWHLWSHIFRNASETKTSHTNVRQEQVVSRWINAGFFSAIVYVLRTGMPWKALPKEFGAASSVHQYFQQWEQAGVFLALWKAGLAEYDEMEVGMASH